MKSKIFVCIFIVVLTAAAVVAWLNAMNMQIEEKETTDAQTEAYETTEESMPDTNSEEEVPRMVMADGVLYKYTGITSHILRCGVMDGMISSTVEEGEIPTENDQSNFGEGYGYQRSFKESRIEVCMDDVWYVFSAEEVDWGVTLSTQDETSTGVTILCTRTGGNPTGALQTESYYVLETLKDGVWTALDYYAEVAWTSEAWEILPDNTVCWNVEWEWLYGELKPGMYRIGKRVLDFRNTGNYDSKMFYAEFAIVD